MKKQTLLLMAGGMLAFASCNTGDTGGYTEEQVDALVNERVAVIQSELEAKNDSLIHALALEKADSIIAATQGSAVPARKTPSKPSTPAAKTEEPKSKAPTVSDRPGATNNEPKKVTDRPGATNNEPKKVTDRPGAR